MRKRSLSSMLLSIIVVIAVLFLSFPLETEKVQAKDRKHTLVFVSNEISSEQISELFTSNEKTMQKVLKSVNEQKIKVKNISSPQQLKNSPSFQSLAIHYKTLENNNEIKSYVQEQYNSGKTIYLYGGLTFKKYAQLLGLEEMKANVGTEQKPIFVDFLEDKKQIEMEKGINLTDTETLENISEIIGYTNENEIPRIWGGNITNKNKKGQDLLISDELYLREILKQEAEVIQSNAQDVSTFSSTRRDRSATKTSTAYYASGPAGTLTSFYKLYQSLDESDSDTDLFTVENTVQVVANSGWRATVLNMENSLPWSSDNMDAYNPKDDSSSPYSVTFGFPINLNFTFYHSDNPNINSSGSFSNDWARWYVTDYNMSDDSYFTPGMSWTSYGTLATADLDYSATFRSGIDVSTSTSQHWDIYYDYQ